MLRLPMSMPAIGLIFAFFPAALADLPVHCLRHQVVGEWHFKLSPLREQRSACGHEHPDVEEHQPSSQLVDAQGSNVTQLVLTLKNPNVAVTSQGTKGVWTMVYDEGFEVNVGGMSYFAFSNFTFEGSPKKHNVSHCGQTMVGWYRNANRTRFGCYYGALVQPATAPTASPKAATLAQAAPVRREEAEDKTYSKPLDKETQTKKVASLNKKLAMLQLSWRARAVSKWNGKTLREVNAYAGLRRGGLSARELRREMLRQGESMPKLRSARPHSFLQRASALPKSFDWSDVNSMNYLEPVMDQQDCGSCYAASSVRMLSARHKIKQNNTDLLPWSISFPLHCSEYNQGC
jgi:cathepsin C